MTGSTAARLCDGSQVIAMTLALAVVGCLPLGASAQSQPLLAITSPAAGTVVSPGETLKVIVTSPAGVAFSGLLLIGEYPIGITDEAESVPALFSVTIPADTSCRVYALSVFGFTATSKQQASTSILLDVERADLPRRISSQQGAVQFGAQGETVPLIVLGHFHDRILDVTESSKMTYSSSDPRVATVNANGMITAVGQGRASISAVYGPAEANLRLIIPVTVPE